MESLERTPTPREMLFSLQRHLQKLVSSSGDFYGELSKIAKEGELDVTDDVAVAAREKFFEELYAVVPPETDEEDDEGTVDEIVSALETLRKKYEELSLTIEAALAESNFSGLIDFLEREQRQIYDDALFKMAPEYTDVDTCADFDVLIDWYNKILNDTISIVDKIYSDPEFDLK